jgi:Tol biopolymer transport system component
VLENVMQSLNTPNSSDEVGAGQFAVSTSGTLVYLPGGVSPNLESSWEWIERTGARKSVEGVPAASYLFPRLSPDGRRVAVNVRRAASRGADVWVYDLLRAAPTRLTIDGASSSPVWSPDGTRVAFNSSADTQRLPNLYLVNADGSGKPERLTTSEFTQIPSSWNEATGLLAFLQRPGLETTGIWVLPVNSRPAVPKLFLESPFTLSHAEFSPDGRWMAYVSNESGGPEVYVQPFPGPGEKVRVSTDSTNGGIEPIWASDGRALLYRGYKPGGVFAVTISSVSPFRVEPPRQLIELSTNDYDSTSPVRSWNVSPDSQRFLVSRFALRVQPITTLHIVQNWSEELRRVVAAK